MELVVNEWLPEYFRPDADGAEKEMLEKFLNKFIVKEDIIFVRSPSPFLQKILRFAKLYQTNVKVYQSLSLFINLILYDSRRCVFIDGDCDLEAIVLEKLGVGNYSRDMYLFEAASKTITKLIITTDEKLCRQMHNVAEYKVVHLKDFLQQY